MGSLTSRDVLDICAAVRECGTSYAHELAARLGLDLDQPMAELSRGQLRRLGIVQALMHKPELVVLDDPMTELDEPAREALVPVLREAAARGAAVLVTAQSPAGAESYADRIVPLRTRPAEEPAPAAARLFTPAEMVAEPSPSPTPAPAPAAAEPRRRPELDPGAADLGPILAPPLRKVRRHGQRCRLGSANRSRGAVREGRPPPGRVSRPDDH